MALPLNNQQASPRGIIAPPPAFWSRLIALRDYVHNAWVEITLVILGFVSGTLVARWLGPEGRGQLSAAMMWPAALGILCSLGLQHAFAYAVGVGWASPKQLERLAFKFTLFVGLPATLLYWLLCPLILKHQFPAELWVPRLFAFYIPLSLYVGLMLPVYQGGGEFLRWNASRLFRNGTWTMWIIIAGPLIGLTVFNLLAIQIVVMGVLGFFLFSQLKHLKDRRKKEIEPSIKLIFKYGMAIYISGLAYTVNQQLDQLLLSLWVAPSELGQYAAAVSLAGVLLIIPSTVGPILFSKVARASDEPIEQRRHTRHAALLTLALLVPAGLGLMILAPWATHLLYGAAYAKAGQVLRILAPATILLGVGYTMADVLRSSGKPMYSTYGALAGGVITVVGLAWALPRFGIIGAAWVSFSAYGIMMLVQGFFLWKWITSKVSQTLTVTTPS
jgi:O-antigen/teichoic acid export membrane protein